MTQSAFVNDFRYVYGRLRDYYEITPALDWLYAPHPQLRGERPIDLLHVGRTEEVVAILDRLDSGAYL